MRHNVPIPLAASLASAFFLAFSAGPGRAAELERLEARADIVGLSFKDLSELQVTSVSRREEKVMSAASAVYVITGEQIRRSGATTLPDALRLAPGLHVAQVDGNTWAISARGFNSTTANKLLVLIDGRSVYTPLYSGVFWDVQNVLLENIDRIEVIRGPGGATWGANAVNGVINIIRKPAAETQGTHLSAGAGTELRGFASARHGGTLGEHGYYRLSGQHFNRDDLATTSGMDSGDDLHMGHASFRADWHPTERDGFVLSSDAYAGEGRELSTISSLTPPFQTNQRDHTDVGGGNVQASWRRRVTPENGYRFQAYYDRTSRHIPVLFEETRDTYSAEFEQEFKALPRHAMVWGAGFRMTTDEVQDYFGVDFDRDADTLRVYNAFLQDEISLTRNLNLILGTKLEYNDYSHLELQPSGRVAWTISDRHFVWGAVSRAVRTPTRLDRDIQVSAVVNPVPTVTSFRGRDDFETEELIAYEAGYRSALTKNVSVDIATFYNDYDNLRTIEPGSPFPESNPVPHTVVPFYLENKGSAKSYGIEVAPQAQINPWWLLRAHYSYLHLRFHLDESSRDTLTTPMEENDPVHQLVLSSIMNLPRNFEFDAVLRYVDELANLDVESYAVADLRLAWRGIPNLEAELIGRNLLERRHPEFRSGSEVQHGVLGRLSWDF